MNLKHGKNRGRSPLGLMLALVLSATAVLSLAGCGSKKTASPDSLTILMDGAAAEDEIDILDNTEDTLTLTADVEPADFEGEITWTSSDSGVAKVASSEGTTCTLNLLKIGRAKITAACGDVSVTVTVNIQKNQDALSEKDIAVTVNGTNYSVEKMNFYFVDGYNEFVNYYGSYASYYGLDTSAGLSGLADQECDYSEDGTWKGFFIEQAIDNLKQIVALRDYADENGIALDDDDEQEVQNQLDALTEAAENTQCVSTEAYLARIYGDGATLELYTEYLRQQALAQKAYNTYLDSLTYTDEEIADHYAEMGYEDGENDYPTASMRHILIMAEADEDGNYSDEAIQAAHDRAEELYEEWKSGDATEDSFAEMANEYSEDEGSNTTGGLYEDIYKDQMVTGINDWLFEDGRAEGDTAVIDNNGSYVGTHIVYFCGYGEDYSTYLSETDLKDTESSEWMDALEEACEVTNGAAYDSIGEID